jgi:signal transduction histidine kinase
LSEQPAVSLESSLISNEHERIHALHALGILDTLPEERFDRITRMAQILFDVPIALVSLVDTDRQWFKSCMGIGTKETPRSVSFCSHAILDDPIMLVENALEDKRFANNELVTGPPYIRFYAGRPIRGPNNQKMGTLCILDNKPRNLSKADRKMLNDLASWVESEFNAINLNKQLQKTNLELQESIKTKEELVSMISHELKTPLSPIMVCSEMLESHIPGPLNEKQERMVSTIHRCADKLDTMINDIFDVYKLELKSLKLIKTEVDIQNLMDNCLELLNPLILEKQIDLKTEIKTHERIIADGGRIEQVIVNLVKNSIDFVPTKGGKITIKVEKYEDFHLLFTVEDNGEGVKLDDMGKIFDKFYKSTSIQPRKYGGSGLGLAICKGIVEEHGGRIWIDPNYHDGSSFKFIIPLL